MTMTSHIATIQPHIVTFQHPSTAVVFTKNPSVMDSLCKSQGVRHPVGRRRNTNLHTSVFSTVPPLHWFSIFPRSSTSGRRCLHISYCSTDIHCYRLLAEQDLPTQEGDLPDSPEILHLMAQKNPIPPVPLRHLGTLWSTSWPLHNQHLHQHVTHKDIMRFKQLFPDSVFHNEARTEEPPYYVFIAHAAHACTSKSSSTPSLTPTRRFDESPAHLIQTTIMNKVSIPASKKSYPWSMGRGRELPNAYVLPKRKKQFRAGRPIVSFFSAPFRPMSNCVARLIYELIPAAFPHNLTRGDVFDLIQLLKNGTFDHQPRES